MEIIDIDAEGDIVLVCGKEEDQQRLRVCSRTLSRASPVFKALLSARFKEGTALRTAGMVEIALPEDDLDALTTICYGLHLRNDKIDRYIAIGKLLTIANLADKHHVGTALTPIAELWISKRLEMEEEAE